MFQASKVQGPQGGRGTMTMTLGEVGGKATLLCS
jgi:hypothetical protein